MKKKILAGILSLSLFYGGTADAARYFMQYDAKGVKTPYGDNLKAGNYVQTSDAKIYYEVYGKGDPILILHGGGVGSPYEMGKMLDELKKKHKLIVMSTRGHGRSEIGHTPFTYRQKADDAIAVLNATVDEPVKILGFSDGAYTAYEIAALYPQYVDRIAAIGAGTLQAGFFSGEMRVEDMEKLDAEFIAYEKTIMPEPERLQEFYTKYMDFWNKMSVGEETFGAIKCPTLLIVGDEDDHAPVVTVVEAHQLIPNSRLCVVPKAWHSAWLDNFDVTWTAIKQFMNAPYETLQPSKKVELNSR